MNRAIFIDRDGTFNVEGGYLGKVEEFELIPGSDEAVKLAHEAGFLVIVITNQAGVARGYYPEEDVQKFHDHIQKVLGEIEEKIDAFYYCPYHPTAGKGKYLKDADCRKPKPGMLLDASKEHNIDLTQSFMVGDHLSDVQAGQNAGCKSILVRTGYGKEFEEKLEELEEPPMAVCEDLLEAVKRIIS